MSVERCPIMSTWHEFPKHSSYNTTSRSGEGWYTSSIMSYKSPLFLPLCLLASHLSLPPWAQNFAPILNHITARRSTITPQLQGKENYKVSHAPEAQQRNSSFVSVSFRQCSWDCTPSMLYIKSPFQLLKVARSANALRSCKSWWAPPVLSLWRQMSTSGRIPILWDFLQRSEKWSIDISS